MMKTQYSRFTNEAYYLNLLQKQKFPHVPKYYGQKYSPHKLIMFEYIEETIEEYLDRETSEKLSLINIG